jgi:DNA-binding MarR family transcriptional regulator
VDDPKADELGSDLLSVVARLNRWATSRAALPIPYAHARLLSLIDLYQPVRISDLALADHSSQPTITQALRKLEAPGWIDRHSDPDDARAVLVELSASGRSILRKTRATRGAVLAPHLDAMSASERHRVAGAVDTLRSLVDRLSDDASPTRAAQVPG